MAQYSEVETKALLVASAHAQVTECAERKERCDKAAASAQTDYEAAIDALRTARRDLDQATVI